MKKESITTNITGTIKGIAVKGLIPKVGMGWSYSVGSDSYGGVISKVASDYSWFEMKDNFGCNCGYAKFDHRKNSIHCGRYVNAYLPLDVCQSIENFSEADVHKLLKYQKTSHCTRCEFTNVRFISETPQTDYHDPSF